MSINMMIPQEAPTNTGEIKKGSISYRDIAIKICRKRTSFQINAYLWERKLPYKVSVITLLICHFLLVIGNFMETNYRDKIKESADFRFNVKIVNLFWAKTFCSLDIICMKEVTSTFLPILQNFSLSRLKLRNN